MKSMRIVAGAAAAIAVVLGAAGYYAAVHTDVGRIVLTKALVRQIPSPRVMPTPPVTAWMPDGARYAAPKNDVIGEGGVWHERHGDGRNSDETLLAAAPTFGPARIIGPDELHFAAIAFDKDSNIYTAVNFATDGTFLVSYDIKTGKERWRIKTEKHTPMGGVPIVLKDPEHGGETIYLISRDEALAVRPDGDILWRVPTGLPEGGAGDGQGGIMWGPSYNPRFDVITGVSGAGELVVLDRKTGKLLTPKPLMLPGAPSPSRNLNIPPAMAKEIAEGFRKATGKPIGARAIEELLRVVEGEGIKVANYHSVDPRSGRMWLTATAPDEADGKKDGVSEYGALYGLDLTREDSGSFALKIGCSAYFQDGSATTPGLRADGNRVYIADGQSNLLTYDSNCRKLWSLDVGGQIVASPSVAMDNDEVYVVTTTSLIKVIDETSKGRIAWDTKFDMYDARYPLAQKNLLTAAIAANGIYAEGGLGVVFREDDKRPGFLPLRTGGVRIDRKTGKVVWYAESAGDSTAVTEIAPDGSLVIPQSPIRSIIAAVALPSMAGQISGGISVQRPLQPELLARDAACAASRLVERAQTLTGESAGDRRESYMSQAKLLVRQARGAATEAVPAVGADVVSGLQSVGDALEGGAVTDETRRDLVEACEQLQKS
jgi:outer membrane protein assembly factor BamB